MEINFDRYDDLMSSSDRKDAAIFLKLFLDESRETDNEESELWRKWISIQLGFTEIQDYDVLEKRIDKNIRTSDNSDKFGL